MSLCVHTLHYLGIKGCILAMKLKKIKIKNRKRLLTFLDRMKPLIGAFSSNWVYITPNF